MSDVSERRLSALRAMANQDESPVERDVAREKLRRLAALQALVLTREQEEAARIEAARKAEEDARAELVRKWERGEFAGMTFRAGSRTEARYRRPRPAAAPRRGLPANLRAYLNDHPLAGSTGEAD